MLSALRQTGFYIAAEPSAAHIAPMRIAPGRRRSQPTWAYFSQQEDISNRAASADFMEQNNKLNCPDPQQPDANPARTNPAATRPIGIGGA
jgi:hypothetical protein